MEVEETSDKEKTCRQIRGVQIQGFWKNGGIWFEESDMQHVLVEREDIEANHSRSGGVYIRLYTPLPCVVGLVDDSHCIYWEFNLMTLIVDRG